MVESSEGILAAGKLSGLLRGWEITAAWLLDGSDIYPLIVFFLYCMHVNYVKEVMK
ncbi:hypothetical protein FIU95_05065 [Microbulbifer sp. THAF38]|nr:hypothetical protein FIU95_05065 [Microbulbifer sp. THAF38]